LSGTWQNNRPRGPRKPEDPIRDSIVSNEKIRYPSVRLIGKDGEQIGIMTSKQALWDARNAGLDLIEINKEANPPVVRIVDLNKWIYNLKKAKKEQDKKSRENAIIVKEIQLRPVTDKHDIEIKQEHAKQFLVDNAKVKVVIKFRGRELNFSQKGFEIIDTFINGLGPCKIEKAPEMSGRMISAIIAPQKTAPVT
jgi:translation initiation factor IF-3